MGLCTSMSLGPATRQGPPSAAGRRDIEAGGGGGAWDFPCRQTPSSGSRFVRLFLFFRGEVYFGLTKYI